MSVITDYTEKINKLYNDSTLSKDQRTELVRDILRELYGETHRIATQRAKGKAVELLNDEFPDYI